MLRNVAKHSATHVLLEGGIRRRIGSETKSQESQGTSDQFPQYPARTAGQAPSDIGAGSQ
jgi:hypothetical protein